MSANSIHLSTSNGNIDSSSIHFHNNNDDDVSDSNKIDANGVHSADFNDNVVDDVNSITNNHILTNNTNQVVENDEDTDNNNTSNNNNDNQSQLDDSYATNFIVSEGIVNALRINELNSNDNINNNNHDINDAKQDIEKQELFSHHSPLANDDQQSQFSSINLGQFENSIISNDDNSLFNSTDLYDSSINKFEKNSKPIKFITNKTTDNVKKHQLFVSNSQNKKPKRDSTLKGPPKNSRFFKVYNLEGNNGNFNLLNKAVKPSSIHHYNPYRYPQNRSKLNPHPDFIKNKKEFLNLEHTVLGLMSDESFDLKKYEDSLLPVIKPKIEELDDIYSFIESIREIGEKYGAVKVVPPKEFSPKFSINLESFWIKSSRQLWRSPADELNSRCEFYKQLQKCLLSEGKNSINKLPCIDKRSIDLYRLYRVVNLRGGFQHCCNDKLWAQIGRELGFYGKISSSLSSSIKSVYQKYIIPWEEEYKDSKQDFLNLSKNEDKYSLFSKEEIQLERSKEQLPIILGSALSFERNRKSLINAGFPSYFDQSTTQKKSITLNDLNTLPNYDFYTWNLPTLSDDTRPTELKISSLYTLKQFYDKSRILKNQILNKFYESEHYKFENPNYLEQTFWDLLKNPDAMFETEVSLGQSTCIHDSSYENKFLSEKNGIISESILSTLNFNNTTIANGSLLQYIDSTSDSMYNSNLNFCMFYGSQAWAMEDHWFHNIDYHYLGDAKSVYVIPPEYQEKFEALVKAKYDLKKKAIQKTDLAYQKFDNDMLYYDVYNACIENQVAYDMELPRSKPNDSTFESLISSDEKPIKFNNDIMFSPSFLEANGIPVYKTFQEVGDMIIKFPKAYSAFFSLGTCVTESVNVATKDWIKESMNACKWLQKQDIIPKFSVFQMMLSIAHDSIDYSILKETDEQLKKLIDDEIQDRIKIRDLIKNEHKFEIELKDIKNCDDLRTKIDKQISNPNNLVIPEYEETVGTKLVSELGTWNTVTDVDLVDLFPSFVCVKNPINLSSSFTMSKEYYLKNYDSEEFKSHQYECEFISLVSDEYLLKSIETLKAKLVDFESWTKKYDEIIDNDSFPQLRILKPIYEQGKVLFNKVNYKKFKNCPNFNKYKKEFENLEVEILKAEDWEKKAKIFYQIKDEQSVEFFSFDRLKILVEEIKTLSISADHVDDILEIAKKAEDFDKRACDILSKSEDKMDMKELEELCKIGFENKIGLKSFKILDRLVKRNNWLSQATKEYKSIDELKSIVDSGKKLRVTKEEDLAVLTDLERKLERSNELCAEYKELENKAKDSKISYKRLMEFKENIKGYPLEDKNEFVSVLENAYKSTKQDVAPVIDLLKKKNEMVVSDNISFGNKILQFKEFQNQINGMIFPEFIEINSTKLSKFEEFEKDGEFFNGQLIDGPKKFNKDINLEFKGILNFGKDEYNFSTMETTDCLKYLGSYNMDLLNSEDERYCVCRQIHEGNMVECEICKMWFHFNCIGYNEDHNKYVCPLCDYECKYETTQSFYNAISTKYTFERFVSFSYEMMLNCAFLKDYEIKFLEVTGKFWEFYNKILKEGIIDINGEVVTTDKNKIRQTLQKIGGCTIDYFGLHQALLKKHREMCREAGKSSKSGKTSNPSV